MKHKHLLAFSLNITWFLVLLAITGVGVGHIVHRSVGAEVREPAIRHSNPKSASSTVVKIADNPSPWIKMRQGKALDSIFVGSDAAIERFESGSLRPTTLVPTDFNFDGYPDLVSGFAGPGGSVISLHRGWKEAFAPEAPEVLAGIRNGDFPVSFEQDARVLEVPTSPDFIFAGRFLQNSTLDLVIASRGGRSLFIMTSDGKGGFSSPQEIALYGRITALASDSLDASKMYAGLVVAISGENSSTVLVFDGTEELSKATPRAFQMDGDVSSLLLADPGGAARGKDVFGVADGEIFTMRGVGNRDTSVSKVETPFRAADIAVGEFIRDREALAEIAVLSEDGGVSYLTRGALDTRPFTTEDALESWRENGGRGRGTLTTKATTDNLSNNWAIAESHQLGVYSLGANPARALQKAYITGNETDDLLVTDSNSNRVQILFKEPNYDADRTAFTGETKLQRLYFADAPVAVSPMRLNVMGQQGFVFFGKGSLEPTAVMVAPNATFTVTKTADTNDGTCNADCSVREAINAANAAAGADMIAFGLNGTFQLTIDLAGTENAGVEGDLDVTQALAIVGNGTGNTILQAGTNATNGIDKVISFNPNFNAAFASSLSGATVRFGRNPSTFASDGFGGGLDWDANSTGTLTISNVIVDQNGTLDGDGGGVVATTFPLSGSGFVSITNSTISNNDPDRSPVSSSPIGGGIFVGTATTYRLTNTIVSNNNVVESNNMGQGGGIYAFGPASTAGKSFLTGSTVSGNIAPSDGGGILSTQPIDFNAPTTISNNQSGRFGGGLWINHTNGTTVISEATITGNSATTNGGAIYLASSTTANVLNMSFSRIAGNTGGGFRGLAVDGGTGSVESNWWGCNTGPSAAPCDTAGVIGTGTVDFDPWLQLRLTASPNLTPVVGEPRTLTASFLLNSAGGAVAVGNLDALIGLPVTWSASGGTISGAQVTIQASGTATATFTGTAASPPNRTATAQVDSGPATVNFTVGQAATTTTITSDNPDPSVRGQTVTVTFTVTVNPPGGGTPTGNVTVSDGVNSCVGTVAAGSCNVALTTVGARTLTATYAGDANFAGSVSAGVPHQVNKANTTTTITAESADPTAQGEVFTVFYTVTVNSPGAGTPTGTVTVSDGANSCMGTVAAGQCSLFLNTAGVRTLTATYGSDVSFNGSVSPGEPHTVLPIVAASVSVSGRIQTQTGRGIPKARIILTNQNGEVVTALSNGFGYYHFQGIQVGETYFFTVRHKEYQFTPQAVTINGDVQGLDFTALEGSGRDRKLKNRRFAF
jgi:CSLREA domain-containing protein